MSEQALIDWIRSHGNQGALPQVAVGPGDDCALIDLDDGTSLALAADALVEGVHFDLARCSPEQAGRKALCVNLSDVAAMGYTPVAATATVCLVESGDASLAQGFCRGLWSAAAAFDCPVVGGDVVSAPDGRTCLSVAIVGRGPAGEAFLRSGARPGDVLLVTGELGGSLRGKHLDFTPRLAEAARLREIGGVTAMIDLSDGLSTDLHHLVRESGVGALVLAAAVPISAAAAAGAAGDPARDGLSRALDDGEDFELLFTARPECADQIAGAWDLPTRLTRIGTVLAAAEGVQLALDGGRHRPLEPRGYEHKL